MLQVTTTPTRSRLVAPTLASLALTAFVTGCGGRGGSSDGGSATTGGAPGSLVAHPDPDLYGSQTLVVDANQGGGASSMIIARIAWGRLVDVRDENDELQNVDYVIGEDIVSNGIDYLLETNAVTAETTVTILHEAGTPAYDTAFRRLDANLIPIQAKSLDPNELPPFSVVPRNAAIVVQFNDLLKRSSITQDTVRLLTGNPPITPFSNARILPDNNHGDIVGEGATARFETTRIIIDTTVSEIEAQEAASPLQANALGLPASQSTGLPNVALRIPTRKTLPADPLLVNLTDHPVSFASNEPTESTPSLEVVRAMRSGGNTDVTGDLNNGYLLDLSSPRIIGAQGVQVTSVFTLPDNQFRVDMQFTAPLCALQPRAGDVVQQGQVFVEILADASPPAGATVTDVVVRPVFPLDGVVLPGAAQFRSVYRPLDAAGKEACFVRFSPSPLLPVSGTVAPGVLSSARVTVAFSEPMNPNSITPFDSLPITRVAANPAASDFVIGEITRTGDLKEFTFVPSLPFAKAAQGQPGDEEDYFLTLETGSAGPTDLAGNGLADALPQVTFTMLASQPEEANGGFVLRFDQISEFPDTDNAPELRGQFQYNFLREVIRPRPVTRGSAVADRTQLLPSMMTTTPTGLQTPISGLGSKMQTVWRNVDLGIGLIDESTMNVDIERINWAPKALPVIQEFYPLFEIGLAHSLFLPDEALNLTTNLPLFAASGLGVVYANNLLDPLKIVHPRGLGYLIDPSLTFLSTTGTTMMPFPLNLTIPTSQYRYYTWRDTALLALGGPNGSGANVTLARLPMEAPTFTVGAVPSVGLPILMEFRCFPTKEFGLNGFDTNFALNSSPRPNFRAYSTGGVDATGSPVTKNPDLETQATGGFNPNNGGAPTIAADNTFYIGQLDLVTRISRVHSIWFDSGSTAPVYAEPVIEPRASEQPDGTQVVLAYRGATQVTNDDLRTDAGVINFYGDLAAGETGATPTYLDGDATWKAGISDIQGAPLLQFRITFIGNAETNLTPELSALGFAFRR
jgi:hypothetical protein